MKKIPVSILANTTTSTSNHSSHSKEPSHQNAPPESHNPRLVTTTGNDMLDNSRSSRAMEINTGKYIQSFIHCIIWIKLKGKC